MRLPRPALPLAALALALAAPLPAADPRGRGDSPAALVASPTVSVRPAERDDVPRLTDAGLVPADGARVLVVNLFGELKGKSDGGGEIGVLLVPDLPFFQGAIRDRRQLFSSGEVVARVAPGDSGLFFAEQRQVVVGVPRYRLYLWDSTGAPAQATVTVWATE